MFRELITTWPLQHDNYQENVRFMMSATRDAKSKPFNQWRAVHPNNPITVWVQVDFRLRAGFYFSASLSPNSNFLPYIIVEIYLKILLFRKSGSENKNCLIKVNWNAWENLICYRTSLNSRRHIQGENENQETEYWLKSFWHVNCTFVNPVKIIIRQC